MSLSQRLRATADSILDCAPGNLALALRLWADEAEAIEYELQSLRVMAERI